MHFQGQQSFANRGRHVHEETARLAKPRFAKARAVGKLGLQEQRLFSELINNLLVASLLSPQNM
jgi:hypothetical protein